MAVRIICQPDYPRQPQKVKPKVKQLDKPFEGVNNMIIDNLSRGVIMRKNRGMRITKADRIASAFI